MTTTTAAHTSPAELKPFPRPVASAPLAHPMQAIYYDGDRVRFVPNKLVQYLLDNGPFTLDHLAALPGIDDRDRAQFAQLIGYSLDGFSDLSFVTDAEYTAAALVADSMYDAWLDQANRSEAKEAAAL